MTIACARPLLRELHRHISLPHIPNTRTTQKRTKFTFALTRHVPTTLSQAITSSSDSSSSITEFKSPISSLETPSPSLICLTNAQRQHESYISTLRSILPTLTLSQDPSQPDCVFIEDTAVVVRNHAVINRMAAPSRRPEVDAVRDVLLSLGLTIDDMRDDNNGIDSSDNNEEEVATCDGGDVLYNIGTNDMFVGLTSRTNEAGARFLRDAFAPQGVRVVPVPLLDLIHPGSEDDDEGSSSLATFLHLKSVVTHIDDRTLIIPCGQLGDELFRRMDDAGGGERLGYTSIRVPDSAACNVVSVNGFVLAPPTECEETRRILEREIEEVRGMKIVWEDASEFAKCDGALTCKSILLSI